jgi:hypothetical protein
MEAEVYHGVAVWQNGEEGIANVDLVNNLDRIIIG